MWCSKRLLATTSVAECAECSYLLLSVIDTLDGEILYADGIRDNHFNMRHIEDSKLKIAFLPHQRNKNIKSLGENVLVLTIILLSQ